MEKKYTPIKDRQTKEPIFLGDFVKNERGQCGTLVWDEDFNKYLIKSVHGGNIYANSYEKINSLFDYKIDTTSVECRNSPHKKKW